MSQTLAEFFLTATGKKILPYQLRYGSDPFVSTLLIAPTGLGKTDTVLIPWLYAIWRQESRVPTRLIFTLPRHNLTEQVAEVARDRVQRAGLENRVRVFELMGGSSDNKSTPAPDQPAIIVGTQDILISRALNRGYARRPFRWPIDFALLNNDCLWVLDEVQLMSDSLATSTQLAAFRNRFGVFGEAPCVWMSATVDRSWLETVDFADSVPALRTVRLEDDDHKELVVRERIHANKRLAPAPNECRVPQGCAKFVLARHAPGKRTLVIANTVVRAKEIAAEIRKRGGIEPVLLHAQFRQHEREEQVARLREIPAEGRIIVSTQVIEAGIDLSANTLITDPAPWGSLVQRFGRVNRYGELSEAEIWWVDQPQSSKARKPEQEFAPYALDEVERALARLRGLESASPSNLPEANGPAPWQHVLRRADLLDLFDTSPDLSGNEIDISRFVRSGEERDCYLAWREWVDEDGLQKMPALQDRELCPAPIGEMRDFAKKHRGFVWDFLDRTWRVLDPNRMYPGMMVVTRCAEGGYTPQEGWAPHSRTWVLPVEIESAGREEAFGDDDHSIKVRQALRDHTDMVVAAMEALVEALDRTGIREFRTDLLAAALKHDWGKAHRVMQQTLHNSSEWTELLAKQESGKAARAHSQPHFRHELASALAMMAAGDSELAVYLAAAHHGRVRATLRSMPRERDDGSRRLARGIFDGDELPECELACGLKLPKTELNLAVMELGADGGSWAERVIGLRDRLGPFRLAFLEMLLRAADERASAEAGRHRKCAR